MVQACLTVRLTSRTWVMHIVALTISTLLCLTYHKYSNWKKGSNLEIHRLSWPMLQGQQHAFLEVTQHTPCNVEIWENIIHVHFIRCALPKVSYKSWKLCFASRSSSTIISQADNIGLLREGCNMAWLMTNECVGYTLVHIQLATSTMHGICHLSPDYSTHSMPST